MDKKFKIQINVVYFNLDTNNRKKLLSWLKSIFGSVIL